MPTPVTENIKSDIAGVEGEIGKYSSYSPHYFLSTIAQKTAPVGIAPFVTTDGTVALQSGKMICPQTGVYFLSFHAQKDRVRRTSTRSSVRERSSKSYFWAHYESKFYRV